MRGRNGGRFLPRPGAALTILSALLVAAAAIRIGERRRTFAKGARLALAVM